ncbi:MAG: hypothetical protein QM495_11025 [Lutibacter sp.]|uniref:hypothetical protein n=1 Tax=Lutibacter sp. TaxID=1925666 RepID=UPI00385B515D
MKKIAILITCFLTIHINSQEQIDYKFGEPTIQELNLKVYPLDSTANAVVLYESGNTIFKVRNRSDVYISTKFYKKIKLFSKEGFKHATFEIVLYNGKNYKEKVIGIKAVTHNNTNKTYLNKTQIFENKISENYKNVRFTMPNLKAGSIIEVEYTLENPVNYNLRSWNFQSKIPKKQSIYQASIPFNFVYNRMLNGYLKLNVNSSVTKEKCFEVPELFSTASCEVITYAMQNIPAFVEEEYMTDKDNFISKIEFQLSKIKRFDDFIRQYTTTWKDVDARFKKNENFGKQLKKIAFFKDKLPLNLSLITSDLGKAKIIYKFIQNHYTWDKIDDLQNSVDLKKAYKSKIGNVQEINISLINALKTAGLNAELMLISTRDNGAITKVYPIMTEFNYVVAKVNIEGTSYLLDATDKLVPFGVLPFKCLNSYGRVLDFKNGSYWYDIIPIKNSKTQLYVSLKLNEDGSIHGKLRKVSLGYNALLRRKEILNKNNDDIKNEFENNFNNLEVINYKIENKFLIDKPIIETFEVEIEISDVIGISYLNPFFSEQYKENPFKQEKRLYPVNFGFPFKNIINYSLEVPQNYSIESFPKSKAFALIQNGGSFTLITKKHEDSRITLNSSIKIDKPMYTNYEYQSLKELFNYIINTHKTPISLKKN